MKGDNGNLMLDQGVTRYQAALFFVQTVSGETDAAVWNAQKTSAYFKDVVEYGTAIDYAYGRKLVVGRGNGIFGYNDPITYQDMLVMAVRALGYETEDMSYPYGYILAAQKLGLTDDVAKTVNYTAPLTRGATAQIMWNMLNTEIAVVDPLTDKILYPGEKRSNALPSLRTRATLRASSKALSPSSLRLRTTTKSTLLPLNSMRLRLTVRIIPALQRMLQLPTSVSRLRPRR